MGFDPMLRWILSSDSKMPSLPPGDGPASSTGAGISANPMAITAAGWPHTADCTSKIVILLNDISSTCPLMVLSPYSHPPPTDEGSTMPSANDQTPSLQQVQAFNRLSGWMEPSPAHIVVKMPLCSPSQDKRMGGGQPLSAPTMAKSAIGISLY